MTSKALPNDLNKAFINGGSASVDSSTEFTHTNNFEFEEVRKKPCENPVNDAGEDSLPRVTSSLSKDSTAARPLIDFTRAR
jgi:hypothetical protein